MYEKAMKHMDNEGSVTRILLPSRPPPKCPQLGRKINSSNRTPRYSFVWSISAQTRCCHNNGCPDGEQNYFLLKKGVASAYTKMGRGRNVPLDIDISSVVAF